MRKFYPFHVEDIEVFKKQILSLSDTVKHFCYLDDNHYPNYPKTAFKTLIAIDAIHTLSANENCLQQLQKFQNQHPDWMFGCLSYAVSNEIIPIKKKGKTDNLLFPLVCFFTPKYLVKIENGKVEIGVHNKALLAEFEQIILNTNTFKQLYHTQPVKLQSNTTKAQYLSSIEKIKNHIQRGDIYEMNYCMEFYAKNASIHPVSVFTKLNSISKAPFSSFLKTNTQYILCASPERFIKKQDGILISQPIKGTRKRTHIENTDIALRTELQNNEKEKSENVMIVDLVRNDFSKIAKPRTVDVAELFGVYSFEQVHQLISTICCEIPASMSLSAVLNATFPMGSMTGAPKISALQLIETYEKSNRSLYSGSIGYITPQGDFDFNVVIRSILYNQETKYVSVSAGSAVTADCVAETEYEECLIKAEAMFAALS